MKQKEIMYINTQWIYMQKKKKKKKKAISMTRLLSPTNTQWWSNAPTCRRRDKCDHNKVIRARPLSDQNAVASAKPLQTVVHWHQTSYHHLHPLAPLHSSSKPSRPAKNNIRRKGRSAKCKTTHLYDRFRCTKTTRDTRTFPKKEEKKKHNTPPPKKKKKKTHKTKQKKQQQQTNKQNNKQTNKQNPKPRVVFNIQ